ncbi:redoxin domain-containing protein [Neorhodopirellula pilleata]|uniref:Thiol-disulfide oxidoreductase ResA n=1 Tax=Neorhodopirellula pilleata TaxID=2714738 RepID=A0A5C6AHV5_9BACT|nr:redoxin domain-containing protein [Neorhodopirellula pilleata]TWT98838.1 Thiol-disulfide oxidoreductase ResA [Neorhodopirellula pilleata]
MTSSLAIVRAFPLLLVFGLVAIASSISAQESVDAVAAQPFLLQMIRDDSVHRELRLTEEQITQVDEAIGEVDPRWWVSRILPAERQSTEIKELIAILKGRLKGILSADQWTRLEQLERQAHGTRMVRLPEVIQALDITASQQPRFEALFSKTDATVASLEKQLSDQAITPEQAATEIANAQKNERQGMLDIFTSEQQSGIGPLVGKSFDFAGVKRTYPRAPEFVSDGATWIQDGVVLSSQPIRMSDLRGKVVAVYFYAFECINCQRNFPHYKSWHEDLADDGLVVIGIQTPETSAERSLERVTSATRTDGFKFPVLFDQASNNWRTWGNTMWPTTYLIDKKGFIRRWWQGEMNWKGTPGEQQMRESIRTLLAEAE